MKILHCEIAGGDVRATLLAEAEDIARFGGVRAAVEGCIRGLSAEKELPALALPRVTRMDERGDGALEFDFDAAVPPRVELGKYLGLEVYVPSDEEPDLPVLLAAIEELRAEIPETYISRKIDGLMRQRMEDVVKRPAFSALTDMYAVLRAANEALGCGRTDDELWDMALAAADEANGSRFRARSEEDIVSAAAAALFPEGVEERKVETVADCLARRAEEKRGKTLEQLAEESFASYLRMAGKTMDALREEFRPQATDLVRIDLLIDEVARREKLTLSDEELNAALEKIAELYDMPKEKVLELIGEAPLRAQLIRDKARAMIVDSAETF